MALPMPLAEIERVPRIGLSDSALAQWHTEVCTARILARIVYSGNYSTAIILCVGIVPGNCFINLKHSVRGVDQFKELEK